MRISLLRNASDGSVTSLYESILLDLIKATFLCDV